MKPVIAWILIISSLFCQHLLASEPDNQQPQTGLFLLRANAQSDWQPALLLNTDVDVQINGPIAQVRVRQHFANPGDAFAEGSYVLPLSENVAVHGMTLDIGERKIVGQIHEKAEAKAIYEQAKRNGQSTGLTEQQRPNLFRTSVANIAAGEQITVTLEYTELLVPDANKYSLRLPLTMTPRYAAKPQASDQPAPHSSTSQAHPEGSIITADEADTASHQARLNIYLDQGMQLEQVRSPSHQLSADYDGRGYGIRLAQNPVRMDRDFLLEWQMPAAGNQAAVFSEQVGEDHYALLMLSPAAQPVSSERQPREVMLIIDTSGSMQGERIRQARRSLIHALGRLQPEDRFNVLEFNSYHSMLFREPQLASPDNLAQASQWVAGLNADGGTEMLPVLRDALSQPNEPGYLRQLIFITDGSVSNEQAVLSMIHQRLRQSRLFTVGIGAAPNNYLLRKAAELGRGQFTPINESEGVTEAMNRLFEKLESPVLTNLSITLPEGIQAEIWPEKLPDLYAGQPLVVAMKLNRMPEQITLHGQQPEPWQQELKLPADQQHNGVARLWARSKIEALMDQIKRGTDESKVRPAVLEVALQHQLLSNYTSFVAVEQVQVRDSNTPLHSQQIANLNPVDHRMYPQTSLGLARIWSLSALLLLAALALLFWRRPAHA